MRAALASVVVAFALSGCGTVKEKTAPCKRPANLSAYTEIDPRRECSSMTLINADQSALEAIEAITTPDS